MGKVETEKMLRIALDFLEGLTPKQFQYLLEGNAFLRYEENPFGSVRFDQFMEEIKQDTSIEKYMEKYTKKHLISFCNHFKIEIKTRDTKKIILEKIMAHVDPEYENRKEEAESVKWEQIENALYRFDSLDGAKEFLTNHELLRLKKDIVAFAKAIGVYVNQRHTKKELLERIADSVVGARLRGMIIRMDK